jgi:hypothetical protein
MNSYSVRCAVIGALALTALTIGTTPAIAEDAPADVRAGQFMGAEAVAITAEPGSSCISRYTWVRLFATEGNGGDGGPDSGSAQTAYVDAFITRFDDCANAVISTDYGFTNIDASHFQLISNGLNGANVNATVAVCRLDEQSACIAGTTRSIAIDLVWTGVGDVKPYNGGPTFGLDPGTALQLTNPEAMIFRFASVMGTVADGTTTVDFGSAEGLLYLIRGNDVLALMGPASHRP